MGNMLKMNDFVGAGFHRLDDNLIEQHPPMIQWGQLVRDMGPEARERYLQRLASTMNHAARLVQDERNALQVLCGKKEEQLIALAKAVEANNSMLHSEVTRMNEDRQQMLTTIARLNTELRASRNCMIKVESDMETERLVMGEELYERHLSHAHGRIVRTLEE